MPSFVESEGMPRRIGSRSLGEFPFDVVRIDCERCGRAGRYALAGLGAVRGQHPGLLARFDADAAGPDVLMELAQSERRKDFTNPCGARFTDLAART